MAFRSTAIVASLVLVGAAITSSAQDFPTKSIRIVTGSAGGGSDLMSRMISTAMAANLGQPVIVDNRPGTAGALIAAKAPPDGHTLMVGANSFINEPVVRKSLYDISDFRPVVWLSKSPGVLVVAPSLPVNSVKELIALAKAKPGSLNYAAGQVAGSSHLAGELFKSLAGGLNIVAVNYKGQNVNAVMGGEVQMLFESATVVTPLLKSGKLKALGVTSLQPSALVPGVPAVAEAVPGYEMLTIYAMFAPARTPAAVIGKLNREARRATETPEAKDWFLRTGIEPAGGSPEEFAAWLKADMARTARIIKDAGIKVD